MRGWGARGQGEAAKAAVPAADESVGAPVRLRRRGRPSSGDLATPLAATFLGLLVVQSLRPAAAAEPAAGPEPGGGSGEAGLAGPSAERLSSSATAGEATTVSMPAMAAGSVLTVGSLIDPAALTRLSGDARFAELNAPAIGGSAAVDGPSLPGDPAAPVMGDLGPGAALGLELPTLPGGAASPEPAPTGDEDLANLGEYVRGTDENQTIELTDKDDVFLGGEGDEQVKGLDGNDQLSGGGGNDVLEGGAGDDRLDGGTGNDVLDGGTGNDQLAGGSGDDRLSGGTGLDRLDGGTGDDVLVLDDPLDAVKELGLGVGQGGSDTILVADGYAAALAKALPGLSPEGRATFVLGEVDAATFPQGLAPYRQQIDPDIENLRLEGSTRHDVVGSAGANTIEGNLGANRLYGGGGDDAIYGDGGDDFLYGGDGDDWLEGGSGTDTLYGGAGNDVFVLGLHESSDHIYDHEGLNHLHLSTPEPDAVGIERRGDDLIVTVGGRTIATVHDYAAHADKFAGIDLGEGVRSFDGFLDQPDLAVTTTASADWLAAFLPEQATGAPAPLADPWSLDAGAVPEGADAGAGTAPPPAMGVVADFAVPDLTGGGDVWLAADPVLGSSFAAASGDPTLAGDLAVHDEQRPENA